MFSMQQPEDTTPPVEIIFGEGVNRIRTAKRLSQRLLARFLTDRGMPVDASAVSRIESGARSVRLSEALTIAEVLGVSLETLIENPKTPSQAFEFLRRDANYSMTNLGQAATNFMESFMEARRFLVRHPELLVELEDDEFGSPASADEYFDWIGRRMDRNRDKVKSHVVTADQKEADELMALAVRFISGFASPEPRQEDETGEEDLDGLDPEKA